MREIKFRGKDESNEWIYGNLICYDDECYIITKEQLGSGLDCYAYYEGGLTEVISKTIGQYIGLDDCHGKGIYEGDIVAIETDNISVDGDGYFVIKYDTESARFVCKGDGLTVDFDNVYNYCEVEVVGNIHDNPELLEVE